jgi:TonB-linked SusC/RagA family outer membrane protein
MKKIGHCRIVANIFCKFLLFMKITLFLIFLSTGAAFSANSYSQGTKISLSLQNVTVLDVLKAIEEQTEFIFFYRDHELDLTRNVSISFNEGNIDEILGSLFGSNGNTFLVKDRQIVIGKSRSAVASSDMPVVRVFNPREQEFNVSGRVTDGETGEPLPGVSIIIEGTTRGAVTDHNGHYSIRLPDGNQLLNFSYVGYMLQRIEVNNRTEINILLTPDIQHLQEVVTIGYGIQKKVNLSGAVDVITSAEINNRPVNNTVQALQGLAPNLNISVGHDGGELGGRMNLNIRGIGSISGMGGEPYILVDGIEQSIYNINPADIESISVLKDAAASAIYGARAAFGVILITTKKGQSGDIVLNYSNNFSYAAPLHLPKMVNSIDFAEYFNEAAKNDGSAPVFQPIIIEQMHKYQAGEEKDWTIPIPWEPQHWLTYMGGWANTDWFKVDYRDWVPRTSHNLSMSGGDERTQFYVSGGTSSQEGLMRYGNDTYTRNNLSARINTTAYQWLRFNFLSRLNRSDLNRPSYNKDLFYNNIARRWPTNGVYFPDGNLNHSGEQIWLQNGGRYIETGNEFFVIPGIEIVPFSNMVIHANYRWKMSTRDYTNHEAKVIGTFTDGSPFFLRPNNFFARDQYESYYNSPNVYGNYTRQLGAHGLTLLGGFEQEELNFRSSFSRKDDLISDALPSLGTATGRQYTAGSLGHWSTRSFFGRLNYNYQEKYLLEFSARRDGSSRFEEDYRWGTFPSASAAYIVSRERFWEPLAGYVSMLKLRASYGALGNQDVANYLFIERLPVFTNLPYIFGDERPNYVGMAGLISPGLTWEKVNTSNFGIDFGFFNNKLTTSFDYFTRNTYDMLGPSQSLPAVLGTAVPRSNNATLRTTGFEFQTRWRDRAGDFHYGATFMLADATTEIIEYYNPQKLLSAPFYEGMKLGEIWGFTTIGLFQSDQDAQAWNQSYLSGEVWKAGDVKYADINGDGKIDIGTNTVDNPGDRSIIGNSMPRYSYSFLFNSAWRGFDFNMLWQGIGKRDLWLSGPHFWGATGGLWNAVAFDEHLDYWKEDNPDAYFPRPYLDKGGKNQHPQTRYLQNGAYLRLKSLQIGYTLPSSFTRHVLIDHFRIFVVGENLLTITQLTKAFDPESTMGRYGSGKIYPLQMNLSAGVNVTF